MYTVYSCRNSKARYYYKNYHSKCPHCGGPLDAECVSEEVYNTAL